MIALVIISMSIGFAMGMGAYLLIDEHAEAVAEAK